jgi:hypothetical protein
MEIIRATEISEKAIRVQCMTIYAARRTAAHGSNMCVHVGTQARGNNHSRARTFACLCMCGCMYACMYLCIFMCVPHVILYMPSHQHAYEWDKGRNEYWPQESESSRHQFVDT